MALHLKGAGWNISVAAQKERGKPLRPLFFFLR
jgi:hypothetical protein